MIVREKRFKNRTLEYIGRREIDFNDCVYVISPSIVLRDSVRRLLIACMYHHLPVGRIMPLEVLNEHLVYAVRSRWVATGISHGAPTAIEILPHYHRNFPQSGIGSRGTWWYHAVVEEFVIQRVRPAGRSVLIDGHGRVVREVRVPEHFEHVVPSDLRSHIKSNKLDIKISGST